MKRDAEYLAKRNPQTQDLHCLYPFDLYPFLRKPFFLIVDSDNSHVFQHFPKRFGQPLLVLMSPEEMPPSFNKQHQGSLFTLFLHCPLTAICLISDIIEITISLWGKAQSHIERYYTEAGKILVRSRNVDSVFIQFYSDDFLRLLILRFLFCGSITRMHRIFRVSIIVYKLAAINV